eukprot:gene11271-23579_t
MSAIFCFLPIAFNWKLESDSSKVSTMSSTSYQFALVASISTSLPMLLDIILEKYKLEADSETSRRRQVPYSMMILFIFLCDLLILKLALPSENLALTHLE